MNGKSAFVAEAIELLHKVLPNPPERAVFWCEDYAKDNSRSTRRAVLNAIDRAYNEGALSESQADAAEAKLKELLGTRERL
jgi:hypothetical protein